MNMRNVASCWLYYENILATHGPMNVKNTLPSINTWKLNS